MSRTSQQANASQLTRLNFIRKRQARRWASSYPTPAQAIRSTFDLWAALQFTEIATSMRGSKVIIHGKFNQHLRKQITKAIRARLCVGMSMAVKFSNRHK